MTDEKLVKRPQSGEAELRRRAAQIIPAKIPDEAAEIIALQFVPDRRRLALFRMPAGKFRERLLVIPLRVNRRTAIHRQMQEKFLNPLVH